MGQFAFPPRPSSAAIEDEADFRQLRHQTKNALTRIVAQLGRHLGPTDPIRAVAADLQRRILLTADVSDALFGMTAAPGAFASRLQRLATDLVDLLGDPDQHIAVEVKVAGIVAPVIAHMLLRVAHELIGNAIKHGMYLRLVGRIDVAVGAGSDAIRMQVTNDGWGCRREAVAGEGLSVARMLLEPFGGTLAQHVRADQTVFSVCVPSG